MMPSARTVSDLVSKSAARAPAVNKVNDNAAVRAREISRFFMLLYASLYQS